MSMQLISSRCFFVFITVYRCLTNCHGRKCVCLCVNGNIIATFVRRCQSQTICDYCLICPHTYMCVSLFLFLFLLFAEYISAFHQTLSLFKSVAFLQSRSTLQTVHWFLFRFHLQSECALLFLLINTVWFWFFILFLLTLDLTTTHQLSRFLYIHKKL